MHAAAVIIKQVGHPPQPERRTVDKQARTLHALGEGRGTGQGGDEVEAVDQQARGRDVGQRPVEPPEDRQRRQRRQAAWRSAQPCQPFDPSAYIYNTAKFAAEYSS